MADNEPKRKRFRKLYKPVASDTEEGKARIEAYYSALGRFVTMFSSVEIGIAISLWYYTGLKHETARIICSGTKASDAATQIKDLAVIRQLSAEVRQEMEDTFQQFGLINSARNELLHYGAENVAAGAAEVTNAIKAKFPQRITSFPVSPESLNQMTADLRRIFIWLYAKHAGRPRPRSEYVRNEIERVLSSPWQYKHRVRRVAQPSRKDGHPPRTPAQE